MFPGPGNLGRPVLMFSALNIKKHLPYILNSAEPQIPEQSILPKTSRIQKEKYCITEFFE
jgi:hypothetical protein